MKNDYLVNCDYYTDKTPTATPDFVENFEVGSVEPQGGMRLVVNKQTRKVKFQEVNQTWDDYVGLHQAIPSALALYRLLCYFPTTNLSLHADFDRVIWMIGLRHKSGASYVFGDYKGALNVWRGTGVSQPGTEDLSNKP